MWLSRMSKSIKLSTVTKSGLKEAMKCCAIAKCGARHHSSKMQDRADDIVGDGANTLRLCFIVERVLFSTNYFY